MKRIALFAALLISFTLMLTAQVAKADYGVTSATVSLGNPDAYHDYVSVHSTGTYTGSKEVRCQIVKVIDWWGSPGNVLIREDYITVYDTTTTPSSPFDFYWGASSTKPRLADGPYGSVSGTYWYWSKTFIRDATTHNVTYQSNSFSAQYYFNN